MMRWTIALLGAVGVTLAACGPAVTPAPTTVSAPPTTVSAPPAAVARALPAGPVVALRRDGGLAELRLEPVVPHGGDEQTPGDHDPAWVAARAASALGGPSPPSELRLVLLTVQPIEGGPVVVRDQRVWLVAFRGVQFEAADCACEGSASTLLVLDALQGTVVAAFGLDD